MGSQTQDRQHLRTCTHAYMTIRRKRTTRGRRDRPQEDDRRCVTTMVEPHDAGFEASRPTIGNTQLGGFGACSPCASVTEPLDCCRSMRPKRPGAARSGGPTWRRVGGVVVPGASVVPRVSTVAPRIRPRRRDGSPEWRGARRTIPSRHCERLSRIRHSLWWWSWSWRRWAALRLPIA